MRNLFKKAASLVCAMLFVMGMMTVGAFAATNDVLTVTAEGTTSSVKVSGTTDTSVVAVLIEIFDTDNNLVTMESHPSTEGKFEATLSATLTAGATYTAYVINYSGEGEALEATFTVPEPETTTEAETTTAAPSGNSGSDASGQATDNTVGESSYIWCFGMLASVLAIMACVTVSKQLIRKRNED